MSQMNLIKDLEPKPIDGRSVDKFLERVSEDLGSGRTRSHNIYK